MTIEEMHIDFQTKLQEVYAYTFGDLTKEEIDWVLNEHLYKFIEYRTDPKSNRKQEGFESTQKRYDDIENLITKVTLPVVRNEGYVSAFLPSDYFKLVNETCKVYCNSPISQSAQLYAASFDLVLPTQTEIDTYTLSIFTGGSSVVVFDKADYFTGLIGVKDIPFFKMLVNYILIRYLTDKFYTTAESLNGRYAVGKQQVISFNRSMSINILSTNNRGDTYNQSIVLQPTAINIPLVTGVGIVAKDCRLVSHELVDRLLHNWFSQTKPSSPILTIDEGKINAFHTDSFDISEITIRYVRTPRPLNKALGLSCDLGSRTGQNYNICRQIVDAAVPTVAGRLSAGNAVSLKENFLLTE